MSRGRRYRPLSPLREHVRESFWVAPLVACVAAVYVRTRDEVDPVARGVSPDVDELDEGTAGRAAR